MADDPLDQLRSYASKIVERDGENLEIAKRKVQPKTGQRKLSTLQTSLESFGVTAYTALREDNTPILTIRPTINAPDVEIAAPPTIHSESESLEAIISHYRPVFGIQDDKVDAALNPGLHPADPQISQMAKFVLNNSDAINRWIPSVGRIDLPGNENQPWAGTGWLIYSGIEDDVIVTNAHVALEFAARSGAGFAFTPLPYLARLQAPIIDFRHEQPNDPLVRSYPVTEVLYIGTPGQLDVALMRVSRQGASPLTAPIALAGTDPPANLPVVAIGYPGTDGSHYDPATLLRVFGNVFETKRASPGRIVGSDPQGLSHDCSTMPGSSGTLVLDPTAGKAVGLHFQGVPFQTNHAIPASLLAKVLRDESWSSVISTSGPGADESCALHRPSAPPSSSGDQRMSRDNSEKEDFAEPKVARITVPLEITVRIGSAMRADGPPQGAVRARPHSMTPEEAALSVRKALENNKDVLDVRSRLLFVNGRLTNTRGVVIKVRPEASRNFKDYSLESTIGHVDVAIERASLEMVANALAKDAGIVPSDSLEAPAKMQAYRRDLTDPRFNLDPVTGQMNVILHVSPEAGWRVLSKFFEANDYNRLTVGIYNFTAPHIIGAVRDALNRNNTKMTMTIDRKSDDISDKGVKKNDWPEEKMIADFAHTAGNRFEWTPASISGPGRLFATSYHIKVGVVTQDNDNLRLCLSSGNWASSNEPPFDDVNNPIGSLTWSDVKAYDRDWHAVIANNKLATTFRNHLEQDYIDSKALAGREAAAEPPLELIVPDDYFLEAPRRVTNYKAFAPLPLNETLTIQPVLTPDNYPDVVTPFIKSARKSVLFINQSFDIKDDVDQIPPHYKSLLDALLDRQQEELDVRIIFRSGYGKEGDIFRNAVEYGFQKNSIRFYATCHTKGIIVDGVHVLLGSQNWTGAGTEPNRDASILIWNCPQAAAYFTEIFEFDWENIASNQLPADHGPTRAVHTSRSDEEATVPTGMRIVPWGVWSGS
jgi:hypothetical protein